MFHSNRIQHFPEDFQTKLRKRREVNNKFLKKIRKLLMSKKNQNAEHYEVLADGIREHGLVMAAASAGQFIDDPAQPASSSRADFTSEELRALRERLIVRRVGSDFILLCAGLIMTTIEGRVMVMTQKWGHCSST